MEVGNAFPIPGADNSMHFFLSIPYVEFHFYLVFHEFHRIPQVCFMEFHKSWSSTVIFGSGMEFQDLVILPVKFQIHSRKLLP